ncbi:putative amidophosphoribosyltransferase [Crossiella equi]|uniref:Amidophosphoribosyltransferase n=1 Tax=Crossiella equi TaxID=130796 RepID=A0ABS5AG98_9PSEU|nr:phosphoribosyltransferase [Crossiella equi]MBP2475603.1 putative amidophosphoribosyltransferase [Crossiella equi]
MSPTSRILEEYRNVLVRIPAAGPGVCRTCWREVGDFSLCFQCQRHRNEHSPLVADSVLPIALAVKREQFARDLWLYKDGDQESRRRLFTKIGTVLASYLAKHESCLATAVRIEQFDLVTVVPSTRGRVPHPLHLLLSKSITRTSSRFVDVLNAVPGYTGREFAPERFHVQADVTDRNVLLVDDTWTSGSHAQSACAALKLAGAAKVGVLVLGRHFEPNHENAKAYLAKAREELFDWDQCCLGRSGRGRCGSRQPRP